MNSYKKIILATFFILTIQHCYSQRFTFQDTSFKIGNYTYLYQIPFVINKADLQLGKQTQLDSLAAWLLKNPNIVVEIGVHVSGLDPNQKLSELRAVSFKKYLIKKGVKDEQIRCIGLGNSKPKCDCNTQKECINKHDCGDMNRDASRTTLLIVDKIAID